MIVRADKFVESDPTYYHGKPPETDKGPAPKLMAPVHVPAE
jgi:hypothetical protein